MAKTFRDLVARTMTPEARARASMRARSMLTDMHLGELRRARALSQVDLAEKLGTTQPEVSKIEHRADVYVSTLRKYVEAIGGSLEIVARFPDSDIRLRQFSDVAHLVPDTPIPLAPSGAGAARVARGSRVVREREPDLATVSGDKVGPVAPVGRSGRSKPSVKTVASADRTDSKERVSKRAKAASGKVYRKGTRRK